LSNGLFYGFAFLTVVFIIALLATAADDGDACNAFLSIAALICFVIVIKNCEPPKIYKYTISETSGENYYTDDFEYHTDGTVKFKDNNEEPYLNLAYASIKDTKEDKFLSEAEIHQHRQHPQVFFDNFGGATALPASGRYVYVSFTMMGQTDMVPPDEKITACAFERILPCMYDGSSKSWYVKQDDVWKLLDRKLLTMLCIKSWIYAQPDDSTNHLREAQNDTVKTDRRYTLSDWNDGLE
jgi:hypothetical protein